MGLFENLEKENEINFDSTAKVANESEIDLDALEFEQRANEFLGVAEQKKDTQSKEETQPQQPAQPQQPQNTNNQTVEDVADVDLMGAMTMLNMGVCLTGSLVANFFGYDLPADKLSASEAQLKKLAKVGQPLYEKYVKGSLSVENAFIICLISIYGSKILEHAKKKQQKSSTPRRTAENTENTEYWVGDNRYFQTGKKAGQLKPIK